MPESKQNHTPWRWNKARQEAAKLLAIDELTDQEISAKVGITRLTLWTWKKKTEFADRVKELAAELGDAAKRYAIAHRNRRIRSLNDRVRRLHSVIRDRAADPQMVDVPGGKSGLLVRTIKVVGGGPKAMTVEEFAVDTGLLRELREHEKQAAVEVGQWTEKREHSVKEIDSLIAGELARIAGLDKAKDPGEAPTDPSPGEVREDPPAGPEAAGPDPLPQ